MNCIFMVLSRKGLHNCFCVVQKPFWGGNKGTKAQNKCLLLDLWCFLFFQKCALYFKKKNAILCLFLKNVSPSKRLICFILNNLHFPMVEVFKYNFAKLIKIIKVPPRIFLEPLSHSLSTRLSA